MSLCDHFQHSHEHTCGHHYPVSPLSGLLLVKYKPVLQSPPTTDVHHLQEAAVCKSSLPFVLQGFHGASPGFTEDPSWGINCEAELQAIPAGILREDPGANWKVIGAQAKNAVVQKVDRFDFTLSSACRNLVVQGQTVRQFQTEQQDCGLKWWHHFQRTSIDMPSTLSQTHCSTLQTSTCEESNHHGPCSLQAVPRVSNASACAKPLQHSPGEKALQQQHNDISASLFSFISSHFIPGAMWQ